MFEVIILMALCLFCLAFLGELSISFNPFSFKLMAWDKMVAVVIFIVGFVFLRHYYERTAYIQGYLDAKEDITEFQKPKDNEFKMILYRNNSYEVRQAIENLGFLPLTSPSEGGYILVAGTRYAIVSEIDEDFNSEIQDCSDSLKLFIEECQHIIQSYR